MNESNLNTTPEQLEKPISFGRYTLIERIATGGMAEIFKAHAHGTHAFNKIVVIKRMLPHLAKMQDFVDMFIDEARVMGRMNHPRVVQVFDFGEVNGQLFMAMEYVEGADLLTLLQYCARTRRRPPTALAVHIIAEVLDALDYTHQLTDESGKPLNVVHRDVSPSNIFVSRRGDVKLGDFGIAFMTGRRAKTEVGVLKGKYSYMSPEQVAGKPIDQRRDVFAAGVVLAELLMVRRLFMAENELEVLLQVRDAKLDRLSRFGDHIPASLREILDASLARNPDARYQDAMSFHEALLHFLHGSDRGANNSSVRRFMQRVGMLDEEERTPRKPVASVTQPAHHEPFESDSEPPPLDRSGEVLVEEIEQRLARTTPTDLSASNARLVAGPEMPDDTPTPHAVNVLAMANLRSPADSRTPHDLDEDVAGPLHSMAPGTGVLGAIRIGTKRPIPLRPPTSPLAALATTDEPRISTEDALAALPELERDSSGHITAGSLDPPPPEQLSLVPDPSQVLAVRLSQTQPLPAADLKGDLTRNSLFCVLFELARREETGLLLLEKGNVSKRLFLVDGHPEVVVSNQPTELFGQYLVSESVVTGGELSMGLAMLSHFNGRLGDALVGLGLLTPMEVLRHLTMLERAKVLELFQWREGTVSYHKGQLKGDDAAPIGLDSFEFLGVALSQMPIERIRSALQPLMGLDIERINPPPVPPEAFQLGEKLRHVWRSFHRRVALEAHFATLGEPDDDTLRAVYLLWETGLLAGYDHDGQVRPCALFR